MDLSLKLLSMDKQVKDWNQPAHVARVVGALVSTRLGKQRERRWDMSTWPGETANNKAHMAVVCIRIAQEPAQPGLTACK